jgi:hypothetical protein
LGKTSLIQLWQCCVKESRWFVFVVNQIECFKILEEFWSHENIFWVVLFRHFTGWCKNTVNFCFLWQKIWVFAKILKGLNYMYLDLPDMRPFEKISTNFNFFQNWSRRTLFISQIRRHFLISFYHAAFPTTK